MAIYSYLQGGLGNQMFQYAIARALSERYQTAFALNRSWFKTNQGDATPRELQLKLLNIKDVEFLNEEFPKKPRKITRIIQKFLPSQSRVIYQRNAFDFDSSLFELKNTSTKDLYLSGYWQAFAYIDAIREQLKEEFQARSAIPLFYADYLCKIKSTESVMVHIRRGDYVHSPASAKYHGTLPINYYQNAIGDLLEIRPNAHFFIFSDDLAWSKEALGTNIQATFINHAPSNDTAAYELQLMRECRHHIIANSTLSWWGAWLRQASSGLVYAPKRWIQDPRLDTSRLLPPDWKRVAI